MMDGPNELPDDLPIHQETEEQAARIGIHQRSAIDLAANRFKEAIAGSASPERVALAQERLAKVFQTMTAPPETVRAHLDRIGVKWWNSQHPPGDKFGAPCIVIDMTDLAAKEAK